MRTQRRKVLRKIHPPAFKTGLNHCRLTSIPVWSLWQIIWQNRMETNVFASALSCCETGWKLFSQSEKTESTSRIAQSIYSTPIFPQHHGLPEELAVCVTAPAAASLSPTPPTSWFV